MALNQLRLARLAARLPIRAGSRADLHYRGDHVRFVADRIMGVPLSEFDSEDQIAIMAVAMAAIRACDEWSNTK